MNKNDNPLDEKNVFLLMNIRNKAELKNSLYFDLTYYYAFYNHKHAKVKIMKDSQWLKSNEFKILAPYFHKLENHIKTRNMGYKYDDTDQFKILLPLKDRLFTNKQIQEKANYYINSKYIDELKW